MTGKFTRTITQIDAILDDVAAAKGSSGTLTAALAAKAESAALTAETSAREALAALESDDRAALAELIDSGAKNLLDVLAAQGYRAGQETDFPITVGGVTFSESGGMLTTSGIASSTLTFRAPVPLPIGTYFVSGCPAGGSDAKYRIDLREPATNTIIGDAKDYGNGFEISVSEARTVDWCIRIQSGVDMSGLTFKPMICPAAAYKISPAFVPYVPSNAALYAMLQSLEANA